MSTLQTPVVFVYQGVGSYALYVPEDLQEAAGDAFIHFRDAHLPGTPLKASVALTDTRLIRMVRESAKSQGLPIREDISLMQIRCPYCPYVTEANTTADQQLLAEHIADAHQSGVPVQEPIGVEKVEERAPRRTLMQRVNVGEELDPETVAFVTSGAEQLKRDREAFEAEREAFHAAQRRATESANLARGEGDANEQHAMATEAAASERASNDEPEGGQSEADLNAAVRNENQDANDETGATPQGRSRSKGSDRR